MMRSIATTLARARAVSLFLTPPPPPVTSTVVFSRGSNCHVMLSHARRSLFTRSSPARAFFRNERPAQLQYFKTVDGRDPRLRGLSRGVVFVLVAVGGTTVVFVLLFSDRAPYTNRWRVVVPLRSFAHTLEQNTRAQIQAQYGARFLPPSSPATLLVKRVAQRLIRANGLEDRDWQFLVIADKSANAFVSPGGTVCVFSGLLQLLETEDQVRRFIPKFSMCTRFLTL